MTESVVQNRISPFSLKPVPVWGLPLVPWTMEQTLDAIEELIQNRKPSFFITANLNYAMLTDQNPQLQEVNRQAAFILADGMPLVWASKLRDRPLPERVTGSDLIYRLAERAAQKGYRLFLLGAGPTIAAQAAQRLQEKYPRLQIAGTECPPFRPLSEQEHEELLTRIRSTKPDILMVAFGQPKGEFWIVNNLDRLGIPVSVQVGASLDFVAGVVKRSPKIFQKIGLEWLYRLLQEPKRLTGRYVQNLRFLATAWCASRFRRKEF